MQQTLHRKCVRCREMGRNRKCQPGGGRRAHVVRARCSQQQGRGFDAHLGQWAAPPPPTTRLITTTWLGADGAQKNTFPQLENKTKTKNVNLNVLSHNAKGMSPKISDSGQSIALENEIRFNNKPCCFSGDSRLCRIVWETSVPQRPHWAPNPRPHSAQDWLSSKDRACTWWPDRV